jgi:plasmid stabilization system protein ParE
MEIRWSEPAVADLESIRNYIARDSEHYAVDFTTRIINAVEKLSILPSIGRKVPEVDDDNIREIIFYNYRIVYRKESDNELLILGIIHAARDFNIITPHPWEVI